ncbi:MAG: clostripain-related cysteine peptidase, partial [Bacteroidales bacterium]|nr:clostripain-related cysteine peptidase [Bacteroidales bacterium]
MIADNNLDYFSVKNINEMEAGFNNNYNGNLLVYVDRAEGATPSHPIVYKISQDTTEAIMSEVAFVYEEQNSANETVMT